MSLIYHFYEPFINYFNKLYKLSGVFKVRYHRIKILINYWIESSKPTLKFYIPILDVIITRIFSSV